MNRDAFEKIYRKLKSFLVPGLKYSQAIFEEVLQAHCPETGKWLDLGCGHQLLPPWRLQQETALVRRAKLIVGIDYDHSSLTKHQTLPNRVRGDISRLPFPHDTFDLITSNMVFEHLDNPKEQLKEIHRVLSRGGKLIFHTPNKFGHAALLARIIPEWIRGKLLYLLQGRREEDVFPVYYRVNSPSEINRLAGLAGFRVLTIRRICSSANFIMIPPLVFLELLYIRFLMSKAGKTLRPNIIAILEKP